MGRGLTAKRLEFGEQTKKKAYALRGGRCPGLIEIGMSCGVSLRDGCEYDHIKRCEIEPDNSLANCRPLCPNCHKIKTLLDSKSAAKGRHIRGETKKSQRPKAKIQSRGFPSPEQRKAIKERYNRG
jgi:5-methylcytosine-specific restriction endonuclease McrA